MSAWAVILGSCSSAPPVSPWEKKPENSLVMEESREIMKSRFQVRLWFKDANEKRGADGAFDAAFGELQRIAKIADHEDPGSELAKVNETADKKPVKLSRELFEMFTIASRMNQRTGGVFDVTFLPIQQAIEKHGKDAGLEAGVADYANDVAREKKKVGQANLILDAKAGTLRFGKPQMKAGIKGLAKGYAAQRAGERLARIKGLDGFAVIAGNVLVAGGEDAFKDPGIMCVEHPTELGSCAYRLHPAQSVKLIALAMSASGDRPGQIYDPKSGQRKARLGGAVVVGAEAAWVQATATAVSAMDNKRTAAILKSHESPLVVGAFFENGYSQTLSGSLEPLAKVTKVEAGEVIAR